MIDAFEKPFLLRYLADRVHYWQVLDEIEDKPPEVIKEVIDELDNIAQELVEIPGVDFAENWRTDEPPKKKSVLVTIENARGYRETETGNLHDDGEWYIYERGGILRSGTVVAWREMPEPYGDD